MAVIWTVTNESARTYFLLLNLHFPREYREDYEKSEKPLTTEDAEEYREEKSCAVEIFICNFFPVPILDL